MTDIISRRTVLAGLGASAAAGLRATTPAGAASARDTSQVRLTGVAAAPPVTPGLAYVLLDPLAFVPGEGGGRIQTIEGGVTTTAAQRVDASLTVPVGSVLTELLCAYMTPAPASGPVLGMFRKPLDGSIMTNPATLLLPEGSGSLVASMPLDEPVDGSSTYSLQFFVGFTNPTAVLEGVRVGYVPPPQAFVPITPVPRVLDTRLTGGKLNPNEERVVDLHVPSFARAAVANVTVTETEAAGYVAVFANDVPWPGNSSVNWFGPDQNIANTVVTGTDPNGRIKIRGGVARAQVVIDVNGYLL